jgi:hypothetical protein
MKPIATPIVGRMIISTGQVLTSERFTEESKHDAQALTDSGPGIRNPIEVDNV